MTENFIMLSKERSFLCDRKVIFVFLLLGLPENFNDENFVPPKVADSIIEVLCKRHQAISVEAEALKIYPLRNHIIKLFNERVLRGDQAHLSGILEALNFDGNQKAINKIYEQHVLSVGDIDERIFLGMNKFYF